MAWVILTLPPAAKSKDVRSLCFLRTVRSELT